MEKKRCLLTLVGIFLIPYFTYAQYGFLWNHPQGDPFNFTNNQFECPIFEPYWNVFDLEEKRGDKSVIDSRMVVRDFNSNGYCDVFVGFGYVYDAAETDGFPPEKSFTPFMLMLFNPDTGRLEDASHLIKNNVGQPLTRKIVSGDLNNDGILDFAIASHPTWDGVNYSYLDIVLSTDDGWEQINLLKVDWGCCDTEETFSFGYFHGLAIGDVNNNGYLDIILSNWGGGSQGLITFLNNGDGEFNHFYAIKNPDIQRRESFTNELYDINGDGCLDTIMSGVDDYGAIILYGSCDGYFGEKYTELHITSEESFGGGLFQHFVFTDMNGNGLSDLVASVTNNDYEEWRFIFFENKGVQNGKVIFEEISDRINPGLHEQGFYDRVDGWTGWVDFFSVYDINNNGSNDIILHQFDAMVQHNFMIFAPFLFTRFLISDSEGSYYFAKYPLTKEIEKARGFKSNDSLFIKFDIELLVDDFRHDSTKHEVKAFRGEISEWVLYYSDEPFIYREETGVKRLMPTVKNRNVEDQIHYLASLTLGIDRFFDETTYIRVSYIDQYGIEFPLSPLFYYQNLFDEYIILDTEDNQVVIKGTGGWQQTDNFRDSYGGAASPAWRALAGDGSNRVEYYPELEGAIYEVFGWWPAYDDNAKDTPYSITHSDGTTVVRVNQKINSAEWVSLGEFQFTGSDNDKVVISNDTTDCMQHGGHHCNEWVVADAVKFVKIRDTVPDKDEVPEIAKLYQNFPNPFFPMTQIQFDLPESKKVTMKVYDLNGRLVKELLNQVALNAGRHLITFDGSGFSSGIYIYTLTSNSGLFETQKMIMIR